MKITRRLRGLPAIVSTAPSFEAIFSVIDDRPTGTVVGTISVKNPIGTYEFFLVDSGFNHISLIQLTNTTAELRINQPVSFEIRQAFDVVISADNGAGSFLIQSFNIKVVDAVEATPTSNPGMFFNEAANSGLIGAIS